MRVLAKSCGSTTTVNGIADTGATVCICGDKRCFVDLKQCHVNVECANGSIMECHWRGTLLLKVGSKFLVLKNSLFIPGSATLVAISYLTNKLKYTISLDKNGMYLFKDNESYRSGSPTFTLSKKITDTLWRFPLQVFEKDDSKRNKVFVASMSDDLDPEIIHARYIHCSLPYLQKIYPQLRNCRELPPCDPCHAMVPRKRYKSMYSNKSEQLSTHLAGFVGNIPDESTRLRSQPAEMEEKTGSFFFNDFRNDPPEPGDPTPFPEFATGVFSDKFMHAILRSRMAVLNLGCLVGMTISQESTADISRRTRRLQPVNLFEATITFLS